MKKNTESKEKPSEFSQVEIALNDRTKDFFFILWVEI